MTRPASLIVVQVSQRKQPKATPELVWHAAADPERTLCGRHAGLALVTAYEPVVLRYEATDDGEIPVYERWPKHWPSTERRKACDSCVHAAELLWRKVDREPNVEVLNDALVLKRLAGPLTEAVAEARDRLAAIGYPNASRSGGGGVADDTGRFATEATEIVDWLDAVRDVKAQVHDDVLELMRLVARYAPKAETTKPRYCGDAQRAMSEAERAGWVQDEQCRRYEQRANGLCDRCGIRYARREIAS